MRPENQEFNEALRCNRFVYLRMSDFAHNHEWQSHQTPISDENDERKRYERDPVERFHIESLRFRESVQAENV